MGGVIGALNGILVIVGSLVAERLDHTVDGSEIPCDHQLRLVVYIPIFIGLEIHPGRLAGFLNHQQYLIYSDMGGYP